MSDESVLDRGSSQIEISTPERVTAIIFTASAVILDGFDNQLLGYIASAAIVDWGIERNDFAWIIAASLAMMCFGTALAGRIGDEFGRRPALIGSVALFGFFTTLSAMAPGVWSFAILRCIAALGLGGAMPIATALLAEFAPERRRGLIVSLGIICVPAGGLLGGLVAAVVLSHAGWQTLVAIGGLAPIGLSALMLIMLPESPFYLARRRAQADRTPLAFEKESSAGLGNAGRQDSGATAFGLFVSGWRRDTFSLWGAFFFCLLAVYAMFNWGPSLLTQAGLDIASASWGLAAFNFGGICGALIGALCVDRYGSKRPMVAMAIGGAVCSVAVSYAIDAGASRSVIITLLAAAGFCIPGLQVLLFALAAEIYPSAARGTGVGAALAVGRTGAVLSALAGSLMLNAGPSNFLGLLTASMLFAAFCLLVITRHRSGGERSATAVSNDISQRISA